MNIRIDDLKGNEIARLLEEHLEDMRLHSPPESIHTLELNALRASSVTFWSVWLHDKLVGCGALKELDKTHGEIKSMRTARSFLRKGVASKMLSHILNEANSRSYSKISLETGSMEVFAPARNLYKKNGFHYCSPFAEYIEDPNSIFMTKNLAK